VDLEAIYRELNFHCLQLQPVSKPEDISTIYASDNQTTAEAALEDVTNDVAMDDSKCLASDSSQICRAR